ncbi:Succinate--CoA ligase [GDP-forming] subunit beta, mitochondrial [Entomortierella beljakovae]|nr:Succinate--CoA ligase [GDP-forming] subunit beta, mitochondrial [Entomortierella beljakovae]
MLTSSDLENETYLFKAALTELRTELQILRKNDAAALAIRSEIISREIDSLNQKLGEDIANVKSDIAIDMNSRKSDVREEQKQLEIRIQSMSNHYMAQIGDMRTKMEAAKWETTRKGMMAIFITAALILLSSRIYMSTKDEKVPEDYIDPYVNHSNSQNNNDGMVPDSFVSLCLPSKVLERTAAMTGCQVRHLYLHEYQSKQLMSKYNINIQRFVISESIEQAENAPNGLKAQDIIIKPQIHSRGRSRGEFSSGLKNGIHFTKDPTKVPEIVSNMLGYKLKTKCTPGDGMLVSKVMIAEALDIAKETYFSIIMDSENDGPTLVGCPKGNLSIEQLVENLPEEIFKTPIDFETGPTENQTLDMAMKMGFQGKTVAEASEQMQRLYEVFIDVDATEVEINPFGLTTDDRVICFDAKISLDQNALFRHPELKILRDNTGDNKLESEAEVHANGAGMALATMDMINLHNGKPANFLDVSGGVTATRVNRAFKILSEDKKVKAILINVFGGISSCKSIAEGIVEAMSEGPKVKIPTIVRMQGNQVEEGKEILQNSKFKFTIIDDFDEAVIASVELAGS